MHLQKIGFIGAGNMGSCLIGGLVAQNYPSNHLWVTDHSKEKIQPLKEKWNIYSPANNQELVSSVDILVLAVKPNALKNTIEEIRTVLSPQTLIISIAAGITTNQIVKWLNLPTISLIRAMPNTPALMGYGVTGLFATPTTTSDQKQHAQKLMQTVGQTIWLEEESLMDVVTALSGSGPAYYYFIMEALIKGACALGLSQEIASKLTLNTALGSAFMALNSKEDVARLRAKVTSKGGTTERGIDVLKNGKLEALILETLKAATLQCKVLAKQYDD